MRVRPLDSSCIIPSFPHPVQPIINLYYPNWWHGHGSKISSGPSESGQDFLIWRASAATLIIRWILVDDGHNWQIEWQIVWSAEAQVKGVIVIDLEKLKVMFGLQSHFTKSKDIQHANWLVAQVGGTTGRQGAFIRWDPPWIHTGSFLNIPHPGFGHDGDPNLSVSVDEEMRQAIATFINQHLQDK